MQRTYSLIPWPARFAAIVLCSAAPFAVISCGDDDDGRTEAQRSGVGWTCTVNEDCPKDPATDMHFTCLTNFKGGYCGRTPCTQEQDCPNGSTCVTHEDGVNYCFLICINKYPDCNQSVGRSGDNEANCSGNITHVDNPNQPKACVPPSSGI